MCGYSNQIMVYFDHNLQRIVAIKYMLYLYLT